MWKYGTFLIYKPRDMADGELNRIRVILRESKVIDTIAIVEYVSEDGKYKALEIMRNLPKDEGGMSFDDQVRQSKDFFYSSAGSHSVFNPISIRFDGVKYGFDEGRLLIKMLGVNQ